jgi:ankyrin repeat protein
VSAASLTTRLALAIKSGDDASAVGLLDAHPEQVSALTVFGTWLHLAASLGRLAVVRHLVERGADIDREAGVSGSAAIDRAASHGRREVVEYLLSVGAKLDTSEPEKNPLFSAIYGGHADIVEVLLAAGIDAGVSYARPKLPVTDAANYARHCGRPELAERIAEHLRQSPKR